MKKLHFAIVMLVFCTSVLLAGFDGPEDFDYVHSTGYEGTYHLDDESLLVTGGGVSEIWAQGYSYVEVYDTTPLGPTGGINTIALDDDSTLKYLGGESSGILFYDDATGILEGGSINFLSSFQTILGGPHIEIKSDDYDFNSSTNVLTGTWLDDSAFSITLVDQDPQWYAPVIDNIFFTPEPTSILLLGLGGLVLRRRRKA